MKAFSIRQPWAWLIVNGITSVENRTWSANCRGRFYVQASQKFDMTREDLQQALMKNRNCAE